MNPTPDRHSQMTISERSVSAASLPHQDTPTCLPFRPVPDKFQAAFLEQTWCPSAHHWCALNISYFLPKEWTQTSTLTFLLSAPEASWITQDLHFPNFPVTWPGDVTSRVCSRKGSPSQREKTLWLNNFNCIIKTTTVYFAFLLKGGLVNTCHTTWTKKYHKWRANQKYSCTEKERWGRFPSALAFPGTSKGSKFASVALKTSCTDIPLQSSLKRWLVPDVLIYYNFNIKTNKDQILCSGSYEAGKQVKKEGIFRCAQQWSKLFSIKQSGHLTWPQSKHS